MIKKFRTMVVMIVLVVASLFSVLEVKAQTLAAESRGLRATDWNAMLGRTVQETGINEDKTVGERVSQIIQAGLTLVGTAFFILMFYGGYLWFTAHGKEDQIEKAKSVIIAAIIGIIIIVAAGAIANFVSGRLVPVVSQ